MNANISTLIDLETYPLDQPDSLAWQALVQRCRTDLEAAGMFELPGFLKAQALAHCVATITPRMASASAEIRRDHNIYFLDKVDGLPDDHPALQKITTINHTLCADQLRDTPLTQVYEWPPFRQFIAATMQLPILHLMDDELARVNVMSYRPGEALNWHFDRSEFTTTLLLQRALKDGIFQYRRGLRTASRWSGGWDLHPGLHPRVPRPGQLGWHLLRRRERRERPRDRHVRFDLHEQRRLRPRRDLRGRAARQRAVGHPQGMPPLLI